MLPRGGGKALAFTSVYSTRELRSVSCLCVATPGQLQKTPLQVKNSKVSNTFQPQSLLASPTIPSPQTLRSADSPLSTRCFSSTSGDASPSFRPREIGQRRRDVRKGASLQVPAEPEGLTDDSAALSFSASSEDFPFLSEDSFCHRPGRVVPYAATAKESREGGVAPLRPSESGRRLKLLFRECLEQDLEASRPRVRGGDVRRALRGIQALKNFTLCQKNLQRHIDTYASLPILALDDGLSKVLQNAKDEDALGSAALSVSDSPESQPPLLAHWLKVRFNSLPFSVAAELFRATAEAAQTASALREDSFSEFKEGPTAKWFLLRILEFGGALRLRLAEGGREAAAIPSVLKGIVAWKGALKAGTKPGGVLSTASAETVSLQFEGLFALQRETLRAARRGLWRLASFSVSLLRHPRQSRRLAAPRLSALGAFLLLFRRQLAFPGLCFKRAASTQAWPLP